MRELVVGCSAGPPATSHSADALSLAWAVRPVAGELATNVVTALSDTQARAVALARARLC